MTEDEQVRKAAGLLLAVRTRFGDPAEVARSKIMDALGRLFDGRLRGEVSVRYTEIDGRQEPMVNLDHVFVMVADHCRLNTFSAVVQARWSCIVRDELDRLLACDHVWKIDGKHSSPEYCGKCFVTRPGA